MDDGFEIPVTWKGQEWLFPAQLQHVGYTHRILVDIHGVQVQLEPDEERNYRALIADPDQAGAQELDHGLVGAIIEVIEGLVK